MKPIFTLSKLMLMVFLCTSTLSYAQLGKPEVENVYGGRINYISGYPYKTDTSRIIISTESANSLFYADVSTPATGSSSFSAFRKLASADNTKNYGGGIRYFQVHQSSGAIYFSNINKLYKTTCTATSTTEVATGGMIVPFIYGNTMLYLDGPQLHFGTLDASGNYSASAGSPITISPSMGMPSFACDPVNNFVYLFYSGTGSTLKLYRSTSAYNAFSNTTTFTDITPTTLSASYEYKAMNIAPDGRLFIAGANTSGPITKRMEYSDDDIAWTSVNTGIDGVGGEVISFSGSTTNYHVYYTKSASNNRGAAGSWIVFGQTGFETHPNDGAVYGDPLDTNVVYMTTDQGIGASVNEGYTIFEINDGVEAVQVMDFDMTNDKSTAWLASKAGIRKVSNYTSSPVWTPAMFPNGDGSPYYSAQMAGEDTNKVYVGNVRVYRSLNGGSNWTQVFTPESAPYGWTGAVICEAIEVCSFDTSIVFAGYQIQGTEKGGLFYSHNGGNSWNQLKLHVSSVPNKDVDVHDIVFTIEGADTIAYVGVDYDLSTPTGRSVYRVVKSGSTWTAAQDMTAATTSTGSLIVASIRDLHSNATGDTIFAAGTDAGINHPIAYYKPINGTNKWTPFTTSGFPFISGKQAYAITLGIDTVYVAVDNEVYNYELGASSWKLGYTYPNGTQINVLYYDELLVGTGTGLYGHKGMGGNSSVNNNNKSKELQLFPNPSNGKIQLKLNTNAKIQRVEVFDFAGKLLFSQEANSSNIQIDLSNLIKGMYVMKIKTENNLYSEKIMINK